MNPSMNFSGGGGGGEGEEIHCFANFLWFKDKILKEGGNALNQMAMLNKISDASFN